SPPRSGSTLLRILLAGHPKLFVPPELALLPFNTMKEWLEAFSGREKHGAAGTIRAVMELKGATADEATKILEGYADANMPIPEFYRQMQGWMGHRLLVDKTPAYALDIKTLERSEIDFQDAMHIHLVRHPRGVIR